MPEVSVMQKAAPTAKGPQALNAGEKASDLVGGGGGAPHPGPALTQPLSRLQSSLASNASFKANPSSA